MAVQREHGIAWTDETWNAIKGCSRISPGCANCYAERTAVRFAGPGLPYEGLVRIANLHPQWTGQIGVSETQMWKPLRWTRPRMVFVNSMSDIFHENLEESTIDDMFAVMALCPQHTFQCLTKRADRQLAYMAEPGRGSEIIERMSRIAFDEVSKVGRSGRLPALARFANKPTDDEIQIQIKDFSWPPKNVWLGVSVEDQKRADERIPLLIQTPAALRWLSVEPMLGHVDLGLMGTCPKDWGKGYQPLYEFIDWVVCGGESGPGARRFDLDWARDLLAECRNAKVKFFMKQVGANAIDYFNPKFNVTDRKGGNPTEWPEMLRVREFPAIAGGVVSTVKGRRE